MDKEQIQAIRKIQAILTLIKVGRPVFFNLVEYRDQLKIVKEHNGKFVLTEKGNMIMNAVV